MKIKCSRCSEEHDLSRMEPSFALPDCIASMPDEERNRKRVLVSKDICSIREESRGFIRALLPIPVHGDVPCNWGVWVEPQPYSVFMEIVGAWTAPWLTQIQRPARLANELLSYEHCIGLPGLVSFPDMKSIGRFELLQEIEREHTHRLVSDQRSGVTQERKLEWLLANIHPEGRN